MHARAAGTGEQHDRLTLFGAALHETGNHLADDRAHRTTHEPKDEDPELQGAAVDAGARTFVDGPNIVSYSLDVEIAAPVGQYTVLAGTKSSHVRFALERALESDF